MALEQVEQLKLKLAESFREILTNTANAAAACTVRHVVRELGLKAPSLETPEEKSDSRVFKCAECPARFETATSLRSHKRWCS